MRSRIQTHIDSQRKTGDNYTCGLFVVSMLPDLDFLLRISFSLLQISTALDFSLFSAFFYSARLIDDFLSSARFPFFILRVAEIYSWPLDSPPQKLMNMGP